MAGTKVLVTFGEWRIRRRDPRNVVLERFLPVKKQGVHDKGTQEITQAPTGASFVMTWCWVGYYTTVPGAVRGAFRKASRDISAESVKGLEDAYAKAADRLVAAVTVG